MNHITHLQLDDTMQAQFKSLYHRANDLVFAARLPSHIAEILQALVNVHQLMVSQWHNFEKTRESGSHHDELAFGTYKRSVEGYESLMHDFVSLFPSESKQHEGIAGVASNDEKTLYLLKDEFSSNGLPFFTHLKYCQFERSRDVLMRVQNAGLRAALSRALGADLMGNMSMIDASEMQSIANAAQKAGVKLRFNDAPGELNDSIDIEGVGSVYVSYDIVAAKKLRQQIAKDVLHQIKSDRLRELFFRALIGDDTVIDMKELESFQQVAGEESIDLVVINRKGIELDYLIIDGLELPVSYADDVPETDH